MIVEEASRMSYQLILRYLEKLEIRQARQLYADIEESLSFPDRNEYHHKLEAAIERAFRLIKEMLKKGLLCHADRTWIECSLILQSNQLTELRELGYLQRNNQPLSQEEREKRLQQQIELKNAREECLIKLQKSFEENFLESEIVYSKHCSDYLSRQEFEEERGRFVQQWVERNLKTQKPDLDQASAIASVNGNVQVVARAGSGKTTTLIQRAIFLQQHCGVAPQEILLLAFNRNAALQMQKKLQEALTGEIPQAMTFHALAYALVHPEESPLFDEPDGVQKKSLTLQAVIDSFIRSTEGHSKVRDVMLAYFRTDWESIALGGYDRSPEEMLAYRRSLPKEGLDGSYYKSYGEKLIADLLFEHDIPYKYERNEYWNGINYRPDFTIYKEAKRGVVIEYFGLNGDPDYDEMSQAKRSFWAEKDGWHLLEFTPRDIKPETEFLFTLKSRLEIQGVRCERLSEREIWDRVKVRAIDRFTKVVVTFVARCRKLCLSLNQLRHLISGFNYDTNEEFAFLDLAADIYESYLEQLEATGEDDFDGLIQKAAALISKGETTFIRKSGSGDLKYLRYICIDEYQDFSYLFQVLISAIKSQAPQAQFFCVGDDWQAINGFAGSDLKYYTNFEHYFEAPRRIVVPTNYRSSKRIVDTGNALMHSLGEAACPDSSKSDGYVAYADLSHFQPTVSEQTEHPGNAITPAILRLVFSYVKQQKSIALLSRTYSLPWYTTNGSTLEEFLKKLRSYLSESQSKLVEISTTHKYKGRQRDIVIVLDAIARRYPLIHPDFVFTKIFGDSVASIIDEERRLFYVALTRAKEQMIIITETPKLSPFLDEVLQRQAIPKLDWGSFSHVLGSVQRIIVRVQNQANDYNSGGTYAIKNLLKQEGYQWENQKKSWRRVVEAHNFSVDNFLSNSIWLNHADGVEIIMSNDHEHTFARYSVKGGTPYLEPIRKKPNRGGYEHRRGE
jgi:DNA helicase IV